MFASKKRKNRAVRRQRKQTSSEDDETTEIVRIEKRERFGMNKQTSKRVYAAKSDDEDDMRALINKKYRSNMSKETLEERKDIATQEAADLGPVIGIKEKTKRDEEIQKGLQDGTLDDNVYRGKGGYRNYHKIRSDAHTKESLAVKGPVRGNSFFRASIRIDHDPCICKDYKETGFCGFGDSCKFIHDRGDYKLGWMIEREQELGIYGKTEEENWEVSSDEEELPFKCIICRNHFQKPVVTLCEHYFCEQCALAHYKKTKRCFVCQKNTKGIFNMAKNIVSKLLKMDIKDVKTSHWESRIVAKGSDSENSGSEIDADDEEAMEIENEATPLPEKTQEELIELERLNEEERLRKEKLERDIMLGKAIATETRLPDDAVIESSSDDDEEVAPGVKKKHLLKSYEPEDLQNNFKKQKKKTIKNEVELGYQAPVFTDSSEVDSDEGVIHDPAVYNPDDFLPPENNHMKNALELANKALQNRGQLDRKAQQYRAEHDKMLRNISEMPQIPVNQTEDPVKQESIHHEIKDENVKSEPMDQEEHDDGPLLAPVAAPDLGATNPTLNILNPIAGARFVPKQVRPSRTAKHPLSRNIQDQTKHIVSERVNKKRKSHDQPVRDNLPNMNPYKHKIREPKNVSQNSTISSLPKTVDSHTVKTEPIETKQPKIEEPVNEDDWDDLPSDLMTIESVSNREWRRK